MDTFEESLFDDFKSKKAKKKQFPYEAMSQETGWFLSLGIDKRSEQTQSSYILKHKADYLYAQCDYGTALECYKELLQLVPATNIMLCHEINESMTICLKRMNKPTEAMDAIKEMIKVNKTDTSLWLLLSGIHRDQNDIQGAIFALQCCIQHHEEVANYWVELARSYACLSCCLNLENLSCCLSNDNTNQRTWSTDNISQVVSGLQDSINDKGLSNDNSPQTETEILKNMNEMTLLHKARTTEEKLEVTTHAKGCNSKSMDNCEMKEYLQNHQSCFYTLCSLIIARFLHHKYSFHSSPLQSKKRNENVLKVNRMINEVKCASSTTIKATELLLHEKFAANSSINKSKQGYPRETDNMIDIFGQDMIERIQVFEKHWFPLL